LIRLNRRFYGRKTIKGTQGSFTSPLPYSNCDYTESSRLKAFEDRVLPGGLIIMETSGKSENVERDDIKALEIPGVETAARLGNALARNMVLFGGCYDHTIHSLENSMIPGCNKDFQRKKEK
jgi:hypothetical protein